MCIRRLRVGKRRVPVGTSPIEPGTRRMGEMAGKFKRSGNVPPVQSILSRTYNIMARVLAETLFSV